MNRKVKKVGKGILIGILLTIATLFTLVFVFLYFVFFGGPAKVTREIKDTEHAVYILAGQRAVEQHHRGRLGCIADVVIVLHALLNEGGSHEHNAVHMSGLEQVNALLAGMQFLVRAGEKTIIALLAEGALQIVQRLGQVGIRSIRAEQADGLHGIQTQAASKGIGHIACAFNDRHDLLARIVRHMGAVVQHPGYRCDGYPCPTGNIIDIHRRVILSGM